MSSEIPPRIGLSFDRLLLAHPCKFGDDAEDIWNIYLYIKNRLEKKMKNYPQKQKKFSAIEKEFLLLYEKTKEKEKEQKKNILKGPFNYFDKPKGNYSWIFRKLKYKV